MYSIILIVGCIVRRTCGSRAVCSSYIVYIAYSCWLETSPCFILLLCLFECPTSAYYSITLKCQIYNIGMLCEATRSFICFKCNNVLPSHKAQLYCSKKLMSEQSIKMGMAIYKLRPAMSAKAYRRLCSLSITKFKVKTLKTSPTCYKVTF